MRTLILVILVGIILYLSTFLGLDLYLHHKKWVLFAFFSSLAYLNHILMQQAFAKNRDNFVVFYLASMVGRLVLSLVFVGGFVLGGVENRRLFVLNFFVLYLLFTGFEIWSSLANLRRFSGTPSKNK